MQVTQLNHPTVTQTTLTPQAKAKIAPVLAEPAPAPEVVAAPAQNPTIEGAKPQTADTVESVSPQYAALVQKEKAIRRAQKELKAEKLAWEGSRDKEFIPKAKIQSDPLAALTEAGVSYDQLTEKVLASVAGGDQTVAKLLQKVEALEGELNGFKNANVERDNRSYEQAVNVIRKDAKLLIDSDPAFEIIKATDSHEEVVNLIKTYFDKTGEVLSVEEAARDIEDVLAERKLAEIKRLTQLKKFQDKLQPKPVETQPVSVAKTAPKTLTNATSSSKQLSARERAILAFKGQLNS